MIAIAHASAAELKYSVVPNFFDKAPALWLLACCVLLFAMIVVGGMTRLTHSDRKSVV